MPHTPAPWKLTIDSSYTTVTGERIPEYAWIWDGQQKDIVTYNVLTRPNDHANTILMTAAPELLNACKSALMWMRMVLPYDKRPTTLMESLESVIKKATEGEQ